MLCAIYHFFISAAFVFMSAVSVNAATYWLPDYQGGHSLGRPFPDPNQEDSCTKFNMLSAVPNGAVCDTAYPGNGLRCYRNCRCKSEFTYTSHTYNLKCSDSCTLNGVTKYKCLKCCNDGYVFVSSTGKPMPCEAHLLDEQPVLNSSCGSGKCFKCLSDVCPPSSKTKEACESEGGVPVSVAATTEAGTTCYNCTKCVSGTVLCDYDKCASNIQMLPNVAEKKMMSCCRVPCSVCPLGQTQCPSAPGTIACVDKNNKGCCSDIDCAGNSTETRCDLTTYTCTLPLCDTANGYSASKPSSCKDGKTLCQQSSNSSCWGCCGVECESGYSTATTKDSCKDGQTFEQQSNNAACGKCTGIACQTGYATNVVPYSPDMDAFITNITCEDGQSVIDQSTNPACKKCSGTACASGYSTAITKESCKSGQTFEQQSNKTICGKCDGVACEEGYTLRHTVTMGGFPTSIGVVCQGTQYLVKQPTNEKCEKCSSCPQGYKSATSLLVTSVCKDGEKSEKHPSITNCVKCVGTPCEEGYSTTSKTVNNGYKLETQTSNSQCTKLVECKATCSNTQIKQPNSSATNKCEVCLDCASGYYSNITSCPTGQKLERQQAYSQYHSCVRCVADCEADYSTETKSCPDGQTLKTQTSNTSCKMCTGTACISGYSTKVTCKSDLATVKQSSNNNCKKCKDCVTDGCGSDQFCNETTGICLFSAGLCPGGTAQYKLVNGVRVFIKCVNGSANSQLVY